MGELHLAGADVVTVATRGDVPPERWGALCDALAHVTIGCGPSHVDLPLATAPSWLWWFATEEAGSWEWEPRLVEHLTARLVGIDAQGTVLSLAPTAQVQTPPDLTALGVVRTLTAAQRRDAARMVALEGGANFSVPGAGKTTVAYVTWARLRAAGLVDHCLVVAPISAHETWRDEAAAIFTAAARPAVHLRPRVPRPDVVVVNWEWLEAPARLGQLLGWCAASRVLVIFDEAHRGKAGRRGVRGAAALELAHTAHRRLVLTGTPRPNTQNDLAAVLDLAYPGRGPALAAQPPDRLAAAYCRTTKSELGLPPLRCRTERVPMSAAHERIYDAMVDAAARALIRDPALADDLRRVGRIALLLLQAATDPTAVLGVDGALHMLDDRADAELGELIRTLPASFVPTKLVRCAQLVGERCARGEKVVVWASFRRHATQLRRLLAPHRPALVDGSIVVRNPRLPTDRIREIARFRDDPDCKVLIATPHTLGEGISLHHTTTHQIHLDRTFNAGLFMQSLDRTHRLGLAPDADCTATYLLATRRDRAATIDTVVAGRLDVKIAAMADVLGDAAIRTLALPADDDSLDDGDVLLAPGSHDDLAALFAHLREARGHRVA